MCQDDRSVVQLRSSSDCLIVNLDPRTETFSDFLYRWERHLCEKVSSDIRSEEKKEENLVFDPHELSHILCEFLEWVKNKIT